MKNIYLIVALIFIITGCAQKPEVVVKKDPVVIKKEEIVVEPEVIIPEIIEPVVQEIVVEEEPAKNKIALLYPSHIVGKYAKSTMNTITAFLIFSEKPFEIEAFDTYDETPQNIIDTLNSLNEKGFTKVIALFTQSGFEVLNVLEEASLATVYFPLIHKSEVLAPKENFVFGGISYDDQMKLLQSIASQRSTMFYVSSYIGDKLKRSYLENFFDPGIIKEIERKNNQYKHILNDERIIESTILLNTPIIKSSIIMSQLTTYEINPIMILSTQLNYTPLLVKLTQPRDREKFFVVNSISQVDSFLEEYTKVLESDIVYNWVDYSSLLGVNYLVNKNKEESQVIQSNIESNQIMYEPKLYKSTSYGFEKVEDNLN